MSIMEDYVPNGNKMEIPRRHIRTEGLRNSSGQKASGVRTSIELARKIRDGHFTREELDKAGLTKTHRVCLQKTLETFELGYTEAQIRDYLRENILECQL